MSLSKDEKYQKYLRSREWLLLKKQVHERAKEICERCMHNPVECIHHDTYARLYNERLSDLWGLCKGCHDFIEDRSEYDPLNDNPEIRKIKFAQTKIINLMSKVCNA
jgi:hypothetical protein